MRRTGVQWSRRRYNQTNKMANNTLSKLRYVWYSGLVLSIASTVCAEELQELDEFIAEETALEDSNSLLPTDLSVDSVYSKSIPVTEVPKSVLILTPEEIDQFGIEKISDLSKIGAGTAQYNDFGLPGAPYIRGWRAGIYFNGMLRAYQLNELPTSFGSLERIDIVKGIAPAQYIPTCIGGYANFVPKSPYYDKNGGSFEVSFSDYGKWDVTADSGGPTMIAGKIPAAYRISVSAQGGDSYYDRVDNGYFSVYSSIKMEPVKGIKIYAGFEAYGYDADEVPGWNRLTQNLVDNDLYVTGEPISLTSASTNGNIDRDTLSYVNYIINYGGASAGYDLGSEPMSSSNLHGFSNRAEVFTALCVSADDVQAALSSGTITQAQVNAMINMSDASVREDVYKGLDGITQTTSGYIYTPEYFDLGGVALTDTIDGENVLIDDQDKAKSQDFIFFLDLVDTKNPDLTFTNKIYAEYLNTDKTLSYGYASKIKQRVFDDRAFLDKNFSVFNTEHTLTTGVEYRYTWARGLQDYWVERIARRDLTNDTISGNSEMDVGDAISLAYGGTRWTNGNTTDPSYLGNNRKTELHQFGFFASLSSDWTSWLTTYTGARIERASWTIGLPKEIIVDYSIEDALGEGEDAGNTTYANVGFNPVIKLSKHLNLFGGIQTGKIYVPNDFGFVMGKDSFADGDYYEVGLKADALDGNLFATASVYRWKQTGFTTFVTDPQAYEGKGFEFELTWRVLENLTFISSYTHQVVRNNNGYVPYGNRYWGDYYLADGDAEQGIALGGGIAFEGVAGIPANNPDMEVPGAPQDSFKLFGVYDISEHWTVSGGFVWNDSYYANYEYTVEIPSSLVVDANLIYRADRFEIKLAVENLTDEDQYIASDPIVGGNTLVTKAPGMTSTVSFKYTF